MDGTVVLGMVTACAHAQWQPPASPSTQPVTSPPGAFTASTDAMALLVVVAAPRRL
jgi:hypothetical protein